MLELLKTWGTHCIIHSVTLIQLVAIIEFFLPRRFKVAKGITYSIIIILLSNALMLSFDIAESHYIIVRHLVMIGILYKGEFIYKLLVIMNAIVFNMISEDLASLIMIRLSMDKNEKIILQLISMGIVLLISFGIIYVFKDIHKKQPDYKVPKIELLGLMMGNILSVFGYAMGIMFYNGEIHMKNNKSFYALFIVVILMINIGILVVINRGRRNHYYQQVNMAIEKQLAYYTNLEKSNKEIRAIKHDMKNHLISIAGLLKEDNTDKALEYTERICTRISDNINIIETGNTIVDAILNEKWRVGKENNICIETNVILPKEIAIDMIDLCILLSNSLDNALEACMKIKDTAKRKVTINASIHQGYLVLQIINTVLETIEIKNNKIKTNKKNFYEHGYGIENMKRVVEKYKGELKLVCKDYTFKFEAIINIS